MLRHLYNPQYSDYTTNLHYISFKLGKKDAANVCRGHFHYKVLIIPLSNLTWELYKTNNKIYQMVA